MITWMAILATVALSSFLLVGVGAFTFWFWLQVF